MYSFTYKSTDDKTVTLKIWGLVELLKSHFLFSYYGYLFDEIEYVELFLITEQDLLDENICKKDVKKLMTIIKDIQKKELALVTTRENLSRGGDSCEALKNLIAVLPSRFVPLVGTQPHYFTEIMKLAFERLPADDEECGSRRMFYCLCMFAERNATFDEEHRQQLKKMRVTIKDGFWY